MPDGSPSCFVVKLTIQTFKGWTTPGRFYVGAGWGEITPKPRPCPTNVTCNTDDLEALAYKCKKERSVAFKIRQHAFPSAVLGSSRRYFRPPSRLRVGRGHLCHANLTRRLDLVGPPPNILSRTVLGTTFQRKLRDPSFSSFITIHVQTDDILSDISR